MDKQQLSVSLRSMYGSGLNASEYLRRFVDLEFALPKSDSKRFTSALFKNFELDAYFTTRTHSELVHDSEYIANLFTEMVDALGLSLRAREQCFTRLSVALSLTKETSRLYVPLLVTLLVIREAEYDSYRRYALEGGTAATLIGELRSSSTGSALLASKVGSTIEAYLIAAKLDFREESADLAIYRAIASGEITNEPGKLRASSVMSEVDRLIKAERLPKLQYLLNKLELAATFRS